MSAKVSARRRMSLSRASSRLYLSLASWWLSEKILPNAPAVSVMIAFPDSPLSIVNMVFRVKNVKIITGSNFFNLRNKSVLNRK